MSEGLPVNTNGPNVGSGVTPLPGDFAQESTSHRLTVDDFKAIRDNRNSGSDGTFLASFGTVFRQDYKKLYSDLLHQFKAGDIPVDKSEEKFMQILRKKLIDPHLEMEKQQLLGAAGENMMSADIRTLSKELGNQRIVDRLLRLLVADFKSDYAELLSKKSDPAIEVAKRGQTINVNTSRERFSEKVKDRSIGNLYSKIVQAPIEGVGAFFLMKNILANGLYLVSPNSNFSNVILAFSVGAGMYGIVNKLLESKDSSYWRRLVSYGLVSAGIAQTLGIVAEYSLAQPTIFKLALVAGVFLTNRLLSDPFKKIFYRTRNDPDNIPSADYSVAPSSGSDPTLNLLPDHLRPKPWWHFKK